MKIAVIGAGAMGSIYGGHLAEHNDVVMIDTSQAVVEKIKASGIVLEENGEERTFRPRAATSSASLEPVDLVMLFVKSLFSESALEQNRSIIGPSTYLMTLQNGSGHEDVLSKFAPVERVIIGTTNDNGAVLGPAHVRHAGEGETNFGLLTGKDDPFLARLKEALDACGFKAAVSGNIQQLVWNKLFVNVSLSAVTGILQVDMGYIAANEYAWAMASQLLHEAVAVAHALGLEADEEALLQKVKTTSQMSPNGCTSIRADLRDGRKTEVEAISGSVVRAAKKCGIAVPRHEFVVQMVHAMEGKKG